MIQLVLFEINGILVLEESGSWSSIPAGAVASLSQLSRRYHIGAVTTYRRPTFREFAKLWKVAGFEDWSQLTALDDSNTPDVSSLLELVHLDQEEIPTVNAVVVRKAVDMKTAAQVVYVTRPGSHAEATARAGFQVIIYDADSVPTDTLRYLGSQGSVTRISSYESLYETVTRL